MLNIIFFLLSIIPSVIVIVLLRNRRKDDFAYRETCNKAVKTGLIAVLPIIAVSAILQLASNILKNFIFQGMHPLLIAALHTFIVLAFAEELVKFMGLKSVLKKTEGVQHSWADITAFMVIIGTGFGLIEDIPYAIGASPVVMLIRGITMGHVGYGFVMGWFYGKYLYTGKSSCKALAFLIPFLVHGLYDFSLSPELLKVSDNFAIIGVSLALVDVVLLILMIRFFMRSKKIGKYNEPIAS